EWIGATDDAFRDIEKEDAFFCLIDDGLVVPPCSEVPAMHGEQGRDDDECDGPGNCHGGDREPRCGSGRRDRTGNQPERGDHHEQSGPRPMGRREGVGHAKRSINGRETYQRRWLEPREGGKIDEPSCGQKERCLEDDTQIVPDPSTPKRKSDNREQKKGSAQLRPGRGPRHSHHTDSRSKRQQKPGHEYARRPAQHHRRCLQEAAEVTVTHGPTALWRVLVLDEFEAREWRPHKLYSICSIPRSARRLSTSERNMKHLLNFSKFFRITELSSEKWPPRDAG